MNGPHDSGLDARTAGGLARDCFSRADILAAARTDVNVLFTGMPQRAEALARQIHDAGGARNGTFVVVDCTLPERALEGVLFGPPEVETATPADTSPLARTEDGTIFLRQVEALPRTTQIRLSGWLLRRSGGRRPRPRLIASTSEPLLGRIADRTFDDRLYYRLNVIHVVLRPTVFSVSTRRADP